MGLIRSSLMMTDKFFQIEGTYDLKFPFRYKNLVIVYEN